MIEAMEHTEAGARELTVEELDEVGGGMLPVIGVAAMFGAMGALQIGKLAGWI